MGYSSVRDVEHHPCVHFVLHERVHPVRIASPSSFHPLCSTRSTSIAEALFLSGWKGASDVAPPPCLALGPRRLAFWDCGLRVGCERITDLTQGASATTHSGLILRVSGVACHGWGPTGAPLTQGSCCVCQVQWFTTLRTFAVGLVRLPLNSGTLNVW